jgi:hypothetical protein
MYHLLRVPKKARLPIFILVSLGIAWLFTKGLYVEQMVESQASVMRGGITFADFEEGIVNSYVSASIWSSHEHRWGITGLFLWERDRAPFEIQVVFWATPMTNISAFQLTRAELVNRQGERVTLFDQDNGTPCELVGDDRFSQPMLSCATTLTVPMHISGKVDLELEGIAIINGTPTNCTWALSLAIIEETAIYTGWIRSALRRL